MKIIDAILIKQRDMLILDVDSMPIQFSKTQHPFEMKKIKIDGIWYEGSIGWAHYIPRPRLINRLPYYVYISIKSARKEDVLNKEIEQIKNA